jgi:hypothetical protein
LLLATSDAPELLLDVRLEIFQRQPGNRQHQAGSAFTTFNSIINDTGF